MLIEHLIKYLIKYIKIVEAT